MNPFRAKLDPVAVCTSVGTLGLFAAAALAMAHVQHAVPQWLMVARSVESVPLWLVMLLAVSAIACHIFAAFGRNAREMNRTLARESYVQTSDDVLTLVDGRRGRHVVLRGLEPASSTDRRQDQRRRSGRVRVEGIDCSIGEVIDLSSSGIRLRVRPRLTLTRGERVRFVLTGSESRVELEGMVIWVESEGARLAGLAFEDLAHEQLDGLNALAREGAGIL